METKFHLVQLKSKKSVSSFLVLENFQIQICEVQRILVLTKSRFEKQINIKSRSPINKLLVSPDKAVNGSGNSGACAQVDVASLNILVINKPGQSFVIYLNHHDNDYLTCGDHDNHYNNDNYDT